MSETMHRPLRIAIIGAGPAGVYTADSLQKADIDFEVSIDLFDRYPAPFGLIRYGVAPDHPRIKGIIKALHRVMDRGDIRFIGNVEYGTDIHLEELQTFYDVVVFATGAIKDARLNIPGVEAEGSFGASDFVSWYDGHPDVDRHWDLSAREVAVIGNGNVALDVARVLAKPASQMLATEIPDNVYAGLKSSQVTDVHIFGRRGPAQVKFTPLELRELKSAEDVDIVLYEDDFEFDEASEKAAEEVNQVRNMVNTLTNWLLEQDENPEGTGASRRLHLHFLEAPEEILTENGKVAGLRMERMALDGTGNVKGTGEKKMYPVQAVYRAIGYFGSAVPDIHFDEERGIIRNAEGRVLDAEGNPVRGLYTSGWIKRGPVGLIGHTKGDALETIGHIIEDVDHLYTAQIPDEDAILELLDQRGVEYSDWQGWQELDNHEISLGDQESQTGPVERERVKVVDRDEQVRISRAKARQTAQR
ncbi:FAD-dependent oxidoreductase [Yaniella flava]|uniref:ferredoxin--NADP(+) reductase n=2 Tax=Yaniella flava TaxID=287930 RepID=A0ABP5G982_9MICC